MAITRRMTMITRDRGVATLCFLLALYGVSGRVVAQQDGEDIVFGKHRVLTSKVLGQDRMLYAVNDYYDRLYRVEP